MKFPHLTAATLALTACAAGIHAAGPVTSMRSEPLCARGSASEAECPRRIMISTATGTLAITPVTESIFHIICTPTDDNTPTPVSQSAIYTPSLPYTALKMTADTKSVTLSTATTTLRVDRATGLVSFLDADGELLLAEKGGVDNSSPKARRISFMRPKEDDEMFYGAGERGHSLKINGDTLVMYNRQNYGYTGSDPRISQMGITVPYFTSSRGYGVLFDDYTKSELTMGDPIEYVAPQAVGPISYYFINGEGTLAGTADRYAELTGRQELPPFWALGYITSKYGYHDQAETLGVIDTLKTRGYPVDGIVLDLYWYGVETDMGRLDWDKAKWPDPKGMLSALADKGVHLVAITQPYVNKKGAIDNYNHLVDNGMTVRDAEGNNHDVTTWVGEAGMIDVSNPDTRRWYWERYKALTDDGVAAWWGDLGEPEVHPATIRHHNGQTAEQYHNVYGNEWSRIIYEGFKKEYPDRRLLLLMRGGTAGLQRYNVFPWTTDVSRSWGGLAPQVKLMLNAGLSGLGYMSSDIGGFAVDTECPTDPELYARWLQMGTFTPMLRTHAQLKPEPYHYPEVEAVSKKFIKMRYEWLPYNYTLAYENAAKGWPLARPLDFHGENPGERYASLDDEYLWGDNVLVAPVMTKGARSRKVLFPAGEWVSWNNPSLTYKGGTVATVPAPLDQLPMFVRRGAFIPLYTLPLEHVGQYDPAHLTVEYFPSAQESEYVLYDDDRTSPSSLADDNYMLTTFTGKSDAAAGTVITVDCDKDPDIMDWMPSARNIYFRIKCQTRAPRSVSVASTESDGNPVALPRGSWKYDAKTRTLSVTVSFTGKPLTLTVK